MGKKLFYSRCVAFGQRPSAAANFVGFALIAAALFLQHRLWSAPVGSRTWAWRSRSCHEEAGLQPSRQKLNSPTQTADPRGASWPHVGADHHAEPKIDAAPVQRPKRDLGRSAPKKPRLSSVEQPLVQPAAQRTRAGTALPEGSSEAPLPCATPARADAGLDERIPEPPCFVKTLQPAL